MSLILVLALPLLRSLPKMFSFWCPHVHLPHILQGSVKISFPFWNFIGLLLSLSSRQKGTTCPAVPISPQSNIFFISVPFNVSIQRPRIMTCSLLYFLPLKSEHEAFNEQLSDGSRINTYRVAIFKGQIAIQ